MVSDRSRPKVTTPQGLRKELRYFFHEPKRWNRPGVDRLRKALKTFRDQPWDAYVFGGLLRDVAHHGAYSAFPRDIDIVVNEESIDVIAEAFDKGEEDLNQFGGLALNFGGWKVDVWALKETWAFKERPQFHVRQRIEDLPRTTFLNVEAVAAELTPSPGQPRKIYERGFFQAMRECVLDVNFELNPYPNYCLLRAFLGAFRLRFKMGPRLLHYIWGHAQGNDIGELTGKLVELQRENYGTVKLDQDWLLASLREIGDHLDDTDDSPLLLSTVPINAPLDEPELFDSARSRTSQQSGRPPY